MMTNMTTVLFTDESRASPNDTDGLTKGWVFNDDNYTMGIRRQQSGLVIIISIGSECRAVARTLIGGGGGVFIHIFMFCPTSFFSN